MFSYEGVVWVNGEFLTLTKQICLLWYYVQMLFCIYICFIQYKVLHKTQLHAVPFGNSLIMTVCIKTCIVLYCVHFI